MLRNALTTTVAVVLFSGAAFALQEPVGDTPTAPEATVTADDLDEGEILDALKVVCKRVRPPTGTRLVTGQTRQQMCMTRADWDVLEQETQEAIRERDKGICGGNSCGG